MTEDIAARWPASEADDGDDDDDDDDDSLVPQYESNNLSSRNRMPSYFYPSV